MNSEEEARQFIEGKGLRVERYSKEEQRKGKTPDFKVFREGEFAFYSEVKEAQKDKWLENQLDDAAPGEIVGGLRPDPVFNRLTAHIHKARQQFESVNPDHGHLNVLIMKNEDEHVGFNDLLAVVTGYFFAEDGSAHKIYSTFSDGRMVSDFEHIDLIIWLDQYKPMRFLFISTDSSVRKRLGEFFDYDISNIHDLVT